jgi:hypothetical protein
VALGAALAQTLAALAAPRHRLKTGSFARGNRSEDFECGGRGSGERICV